MREPRHIVAPLRGRRPGRRWQRWKSRRVDAWRIAGGRERIRQIVGPWHSDLGYRRRKELMLRVAQGAQLGALCSLGDIVDRWPTGDETSRRVVGCTCELGAGLRRLLGRLRTGGFVGR